MTMRVGWASKGGLTLWSGLALFATLVACGIWGSLTSGEVLRDKFLHEPPHPVFVRWLMPPQDSAEYVVCEQVEALALTPTCSVDSLHVIRSKPIPVAQTGHNYRYQPEATRSITKWSIEYAPEGLVIDTVSGMLGGEMAKEGVYDVVLTGRLNTDSVAQQKFRLFVDRRYLVLGANTGGDDILALLVRSARYMVLAGVISVSFGTIAGVVLGALAGFYGGPLRRWLGAVVSVLQSIPGLVLVIIAAVASDLQFWAVFLAVGVILIPEAALGMIERVEYFRRRDFVEAARELGMRDRDILWREIVWHNTRDFVMNRLANGFVFAIMMEITLSYLGVLNPQSGSLGRILLAGRDAIMEPPHPKHETVAALLGLTMVVATFTLLDRGVRAAWRRSS